MQVGGLENVKSSVVIVDDHPLFRSGLAGWVAREPDLEVVAEVGDAASAVNLVKTRQVDLVILDILLGDTNGVSLAAEIIDASPPCKVLVLSVLDDPVVIAAALRAGATGYACKTQGPAEIVEAARTVLGGIRYLPPLVSHDEVRARVEGPAEEPMQRLTRREREIFDLLVRGYTNDAIALRLYISPRTVETHRQRVMKKLAMHSLVDMLRLAARHGALAR